MGDVLLGAVILTVYLGPPIVNALKGKWWMAGLGVLFLGLLTAITAFFPAKPGSWWYGHVYDAGKQANAREWFARKAR